MNAANGYYGNGAISRPLKRLRIAQVAPLYERIPPRLYGGTERVVSYITEELVRRGHDVTLFASGDSLTKAALVAGHPQALRLAGLAEQGVFLHLPMLSDVYEGAADRFDIIHSHIDYWSFPFARFCSVPTVSTLHGRLDIDALRPVYSRYRDAALVSISNSQRAPLPFMNWTATVHHGLPQDLLRFSPGPGKYLAFLGRISPEKRPDLAIEVARRAGIPLKIAAKVDRVDEDYYQTNIKPRLSPPDIEYIGEINETEKSDFLGGAIALLFTIEWPEPFGLAMIEAMACGTPVIARPYGSVSEIITPGVTGFIEHGVPELTAAVERAQKLSRARCREEFERRFAVETMIDNYERVYHRLIDGRIEQRVSDETIGAPLAK
ncbi:MAG TPA: glycosyltransferase family 4 protein [Candidatus Binataceae bacterium]|nr:glycosyltransferase family 4 protein [Candidatus Binataceae bacterium]